MGYQTPGLVHNGSQCQCPSGTPLVLHPLRHSLLCCQCLAPYLNGIVEKVTWPIEIKLGDVPLALKQCLVDRSSEALGIAATVGIGGSVWIDICGTHAGPVYVIRTSGDAGLRSGTGIPHSEASVASDPTGETASKGRDPTGQGTSS